MLGKLCRLDKQCRHRSICRTASGLATPRRRLPSDAKCIVRVLVNSTSAGAALAQLGEESTLAFALLRRGNIVAAADVA